MPVHSESRQPTTSSSSASSSRSRARSFTCLLQPYLEGVAVDTPVPEVELVGEVVHLVHRLARNEPQRLRLAAPPELLARPRFRERGVGRVHRAGVLERLPLLLLAKDLEDHAAAPSGRRSRLASQTDARAEPARPEIGADKRRLTRPPRAPTAPARGSGAAAPAAPLSAARAR